MAQDCILWPPHGLYRRFQGIEKTEKIEEFLPILESQKRQVMQVVQKPAEGGQARHGRVNVKFYPPPAGVQNVSKVLDSVLMCGR